MGMKKKVLYWFPRILSIIFILFLSLFSLDIFDSCNGFFDCALGLFMHNIPSIVLLVLLIISWKHELVGAIVFALAGALYMGMILVRMLANPFEWYMLSYSLIISGPAFVIGILWILNWKERKKLKKNNRKNRKK